jgi:hypothetical protein
MQWGMGCYYAPETQDAAVTGFPLDTLTCQTFHVTIGVQRITNDQGAPTLVKPQNSEQTDG